MKTLSDHINEALKIGKDISSFSTHSFFFFTKEELIKIIKDRISKEGTNCDLNDIDTSLIKYMPFLFCGANFNGDISRWNVSNVEDMSYMFGHSNFNGDISKWDVSNVENMSYMFFKSKFNGNISKWKINKDCNVNSMFNECSIKDEYKPKLPK